jgi:hypothetical protein
MSDETRTQFDYLLNAFEAASQHPEPATQDYAAKRKALFAYVRGLETDTKRLDWLSSNCSGLTLRDGVGAEREFEREYFSSDDSFREFLDQLPEEYERVTEPLVSPEERT